MFILDPHRTLQSSGREPLQSVHSTGPCRRWHLPAPTHTSAGHSVMLKKEYASFSLQLLEMWHFFPARPPQLQLLWVSKFPAKLLVFDKVFKRRRSLICYSYHYNIYVFSYFMATSDSKYLNSWKYWNIEVFIISFIWLEITSMYKL